MFVYIKIFFLDSKTAINTISIAEAIENPEVTLPKCTGTPPANLLDFSTIKLPLNKPKAKRKRKIISFLSINLQKTKPAYVLLLVDKSISL